MTVTDWIQESTMTDWIQAGSAVVSLIVLVVLVKVTRDYAEAAKQQAVRLSQPYVLLQKVDNDGNMFHCIVTNAGNGPAINVRLLYFDSSKRSFTGEWKHILKATESFNTSFRTTGEPYGLDGKVYGTEYPALEPLSVQKIRKLLVWPDPTKSFVVANYDDVHENHYYTYLALYHDFLDPGEIQMQRFVW